jgi:hypothetical protein
MEQAQLGLGHSYSRCKVKFNPGREDNMIIQAICLLDQLDKDVNTFGTYLETTTCIWDFAFMYHGGCFYLLSDACS